MTRLLVSIVTPSFNQGPFIERTLESVLSQRGDFDLEYLVVDGGSTDGTLGVLERYRDRVRLVVEPDRGQADAVNKGLKLARGDILGWLNSDDLLRPGALAHVARVFAEHPRALWLHGRCDIVDERDRTIRRFVTAYKDFRARHFSRTSLLVENYVSQMTVYWRREIQERVGLLDESLQYTFDYDLWIRFAEVAEPIYLPQSLAAFRWHPATKSGARFEEQFREDFRVFERHAPPGRWLRLRKHVRTGQILAAYRVLRALRIGSAGIGH